jgi:hypothetical protein
MARSHRHGFRHKRKFAADLKRWRWLSSEPKAWRREMKHAKRRASTRRCAHDIMAGAEEVLWPLDNKPWIYYW